MRPEHLVGGMMSEQKSHEVILGVDTHLDCHVAALLSNTGKLLGTISVDCTVQGYLKILSWASSFGKLSKAGVEGTGTYGAGLTRVHRDHGVQVFDINRPDRANRRLQGKSDPTDAHSAARSVLSGSATALPKTQSGGVEAMRTLTVARRSAVKAKTQAMNQMRSLLVSAPQEIREKLLKKKPDDVALGCSKLRSLGDSPMLEILNITLKSLAKRWQSLVDELKVLDKTLEQITTKFAARLRGQFGFGPSTAAIMMSVAGDNPERLKSEAALAALCGASPLQASSGKTQRHRLNRGGDRAANNALWTVVMVRMRSDPRTIEYVKRRTKEGLSSKEIQRCLKRYAVREAYPLILADLADSANRLT
jgi:transposase